MDFSDQQVKDIQEIEKQVDGTNTGPKVLSQSPEKDKSVIINLLTALGISVISTAAVIVLLAIPFNKKSVTKQDNVTESTFLLNSSPNIVVKTEYVNPFSKTSQYANPFIATQNPFSNLTQ